MFNLPVSKIFEELPPYSKRYSKTPKGLFFKNVFDVSKVIDLVTSSQFRRLLKVESLTDFSLEKSKSYSLSSCGRSGLRGETVRIPNYSVSEQVEAKVRISCVTKSAYSFGNPGTWLEVTLTIPSVGLTSSKRLKFADSHVECAHVMAVNGLLKNFLKALGAGPIEVLTDSEDLLRILRGELKPNKCFVSALNSLARTTGTVTLSFSKGDSNGG